MGPLLAHDPCYYVSSTSYSVFCSTFNNCDSCILTICNVVSAFDKQTCLHAVGLFLDKSITLPPSFIFPLPPSPFPSHPPSSSPSPPLLTSVSPLEPLTLDWRGREARRRSASIPISDFLRVLGHVFTPGSILAGLPCLAGLNFLVFLSPFTFLLLLLSSFIFFPIYFDECYFVLIFLFDISSFSFFSFLPFTLLFYFLAFILTSCFCATLIFLVSFYCDL